ncbi:hypothetical protein GCM10025771_23190 [Niveibacterium umoris]|uniref:MSHA biogenesis protein MshJ n=1 Tax=Niveibacterium umoris TaxID=1193620 RepID=A0A840BIN3_9RHOO|nr:type II secretion system protein GspM [Niveibacterium umoris]MBB4012493.1 MSHA biogenesis protein MshJ [Niveibacterium umoris]
MKARWIHLSDRFNALADRERMLLSAMSVGVLLALFWLILIAPAMNRQAADLAQMRSLHGQLDGLAEQARLLEEARRNDPVVQKRAQIESLTQQNLALKAALSGKRALLADPKQMPTRLRDLLARQPGLELVSLRTLPVENLTARDDKANAAPTPASGQASPPGTAIYRHGLEIAVRGEYAAIARWLTAVEQFGWQVFWGQMDLQVEKYPVSVATVTIYTLSLDPAWLRL